MGRVEGEKLGRWEREDREREKMGGWREEGGEGGGGEVREMGERG